jgi:hypothetical protein
MKGISLIKIFKNDSFIPRYIIAILLFVIIAFGVYFTGFAFFKLSGKNYVGEGFTNGFYIFIFMAFIVIVLIIIRVIKIIKIINTGINCTGKIINMTMENEYKGWEIEYDYTYDSKSFYNRTRLFLNNETDKINIGDTIDVIIDPDDFTESIVKNFYKKRIIKKLL